MWSIKHNFQVEEILKSENNSAATIEFMDTLADSVSDESSESDLFQSTKLMSTAKKANPANEQAAKDIVKVNCLDMLSIPCIQRVFGLNTMCPFGHCVTTLLCEF